MRIPPIGPIRPEHGDHWWQDHCWRPHADHCCPDHVGHGCHGLVEHCCLDQNNHLCHDHGDHWLCCRPVPRNSVWEGKPSHAVRHLPANWAGGIASTGENMSLAIAGVTNVDVYTRQNHTWHTGTVLAHMFSLARELQRIHHGLHHLRVGTVEQLQQSPPVPMADTGNGSVLDVRV